MASCIEVSGAVGNDVLKEMSDGLSDMITSVPEEFEPKLRMVGRILLAELDPAAVDWFVCDST